MNLLSFSGYTGSHSKSNRAGNYSCHMISLNATLLMHLLVMICVAEKSFLKDQADLGGTGRKVSILSGHQKLGQLKVLLC